jgi:hypothetical protein
MNPENKRILLEQKTMETKQNRKCTEQEVPKIEKREIDYRNILFVPIRPVPYYCKEYDGISSD